MDDNTAGVDNTHVGVPVSGGALASLVSLGGARHRLQKAGDDLVPFILIELLKLIKYGFYHQSTSI